MRRMYLVAFALYKHFLVVVYQVDVRKMVACEACFKCVKQRLA